MGLAQLDRVLTDSQIGSIVAFLRTLTGAYRADGRAGERPTSRDSRTPMKSSALAAGGALLLALLTWCC